MDIDIQTNEPTEQISFNDINEIKTYTRDMMGILYNITSDSIKQSIQKEKEKMRCYQLIMRNTNNPRYTCNIAVEDRYNVYTLYHNYLYDSTICVFETVKEIITDPKKLNKRVFEIWNIAKSEGYN